MKEEDYQGRKGGIDVSSPCGTSLWRERTRKTPPLRLDLELSCSPCLRGPSASTRISSALHRCYELIHADIWLYNCRNLQLYSEKVDWRGSCPCSSHMMKWRKKS